MWFKSLLLVSLFAIPAGAQTPPEAYRPGLGDLMTMTVQPRHTKLALAGQARNWAYAAYELNELRESLDRVAKVRPKWRGFAVAESVAALMTPPLGALDQAIKAADPVAFVAAYGNVTAACNQCHQSAGQPWIVIQAPGTSPFPDQDFRPLR